MDIFYGVIIPLILALLIYILAVYVNPSGQYHVLGETGFLGTLGVIFSFGFAQMVVLGVPLVLGLIWNKWAGGAAGFIMGGLYYVANAGLYTGYYASSHPPLNFFGDISMLFYMVNAIIIGYMAGALNNRSSNFKRMLGAGLTAAIITAILQVVMNNTVALSVEKTMARELWQTTSGAYTASSVAYGFTLAFVPSIALGIIVPIIAKVMTWYGLQPMRH